MSTTYRTPTFGVEFELSIATLTQYQTPPDPNEKRKLVVKPTAEDCEIIPGLGRNFSWRALARDMVKTINDAGYKATMGAEGFESWDLTSDSSIQPPPEVGEGNEYSKYRFEGVEIRSPAFYFTRESLQEVEDVCSLLKATYCINTNNSTGLHVHVGYGSAGYEFEHIRNLRAFLWAFEPQLNSLHPPHRIENYYCDSTRDKSKLIQELSREKGRSVTPMECVEHILEAEITGEVFNRVNILGRPAFNFNELSRLASGFDAKPTVEFRHHEGTLDMEAVINWIKTVVRIVEYTRTVDDESFRKLLDIIKWETWEKLGDGKDDERQAKNGPILADQDFTVINLLSLLGLHSEALYYCKRGIFVHNGDRNPGWYSPPRQLSPPRTISPANSEEARTWEQAHQAQNERAASKGYGAWENPGGPWLDLNSSTSTLEQDRRARTQSLPLPDGESDVQRLSPELAPQVVFWDPDWNQQSSRQPDLDEDPPEGTTSRADDIMTEVPASGTSSAGSGSSDRGSRTCRRMSV